VAWLTTTDLVYDRRITNKKKKIINVNNNYGNKNDKIY